MIGPDRGTDEQVMSWIKDTYVSLYGEGDINSVGCVTGKYTSQGGIAGRREANGMGMVYVLRELLNNEDYLDECGLSPGIKGKKVIVQGFGKVGYYFAKMMKKEGAKIIGIVKSDAAIYSEKGLDPDDVKLHEQKEGSIKDYPYAEEVETVDPDIFISKKCDILAPCATDGTINMHNVHTINTKLIIEGANGPTTFRADEILRQREIPVIPDMLANCGGTSVGYFEWLKNLDHVSPGRLTKKYQEQSRSHLLNMLGYKIPKDSPLIKQIEGSKEIDVVNAALEEIMVNATRECWNHAQKRNISLRDATLALILDKLGQTFQETGIMN